MKHPHGLMIPMSVWATFLLWANPLQITVPVSEERVQPILNQAHEAYGKSVLLGPRFVKIGGILKAGGNFVLIHIDMADPMHPVLYVRPFLYGYVAILEKNLNAIEWPDVKMEDELKPGSQILVSGNREGILKSYFRDEHGFHLSLDSKELVVPSLLMVDIKTGPKPLYMPKPIYPRAALESRIEGDVNLKGDINSQGRITNIVVLEGPKKFHEAAIAAFKEWRYEPARINGLSEDKITTISNRIQFKLQNKR